MATSTRTKRQTTASSARPSDSAAEQPAPQLQEADPGTLLIDTNVRIDTTADAGFIASIKDHGVLQPIVAVRTSDGRLRVRFGHRRTLAAIKADLSAVVVLVAGDEGSDDAAQVERLLTQWDENEHRDGLQNADKVNTIAQLAAFGVSPAQITKRLRHPRTEVNAALAVAGSDLAKAATARYGDFLDLTQAAVVAEFDDDPDAVKQLVVAARSSYQFEHVAQRLRDARTEVAKRAAFTARLQDAGITVITRRDASGAVDLGDMRTPDGQDLDAESHQQCPGHAAYVIGASGYVDADGEPADPGHDENGEPCSGTWASYPAACYVCTDPAAHGHVIRVRTGAGTDAQTSAATEADRQAASQQRREVIANNKDWASAETVRRRWVRNFVARKSAPKGTASFIATAIAADLHVISGHEGNPLASSWLGCKQNSYGRPSPLAELIGTVNEARAQVIALAQVLAAYEAKTNRDHWRRQFHQAYVVRYLRFLQSQGYPLSPVELLACGEQTPEAGADADDQAEPS